VAPDREPLRAAAEPARHVPGVEQDVVVADRLRGEVGGAPVDVVALRQLLALLLRWGLRHAMHPFENSGCAERVLPRGREMNGARQRIEIALDDLSVLVAKTATSGSSRPEEIGPCRRSAGYVVSAPHDDRELGPIYINGPQM
jgi:hypothetical protein